jgi:hypothetical protein
MASRQFTIYNRRAPRMAVDRNLADTAAAVMRDAVAATPRDTGELAGGWTTVRVKDGTYRVQNPVPHGRYVEYGTRRRPANPFFGRVIARWRSRLTR